MSKVRYFFGEWSSDEREFTSQDAAAVCQKAELWRKRLAHHPIDKAFTLLEKARLKWMDPLYPHRQYLQGHLPSTTGFSGEMIRLGLEELGFLLSADVLRKKVATELGALPPFGTDGFNTRTRTQLTWHPLGTVLHVLSGNVFLVGVGSLIEGFLTQNVSILKMSSAEKLFLPRFIESLVECDDEGVLSRSIALVDYRSDQRDVIEVFKKQVDGLVIWGGEDAVRTYRNDLPARTRAVVFGPKLSLAYVSKTTDFTKEELASRLAREVAIWDQNACTAPQAVYVEGAALAHELALGIAEELAKLALSLPAGPADLNTAVEIRKLQNVFEINEARGMGMLLHSEKSVDWTVAVDQDATLSPSPLHRTLRIIPVDALDAVLEQLESVRGYVQTVGIAAGAREYFGLSERFAEAGALRMVEVGDMSGGEIDDPHDGAYDLSQLMHLVFTRQPRLPEDLMPLDHGSHETHQRIIDERLRALIDNARKSPYYGKLLQGITIKSSKDLVKIPTLTRELMEANMPPQSQGLSTGACEGGYVSRSGGSTGEPKFSVYGKKDWDHMIGHAVGVFRALGLSRGDRLGNFMLAGDLYGSFVSFDHINNQLGVTSFAFAGNAQAEKVLDTWAKFKINAVQGVPTTLVPLLRKIKELEPRFTLEKMIYAGSPLSRTDFKWLKEVLEVKRIASVVGANDGGQIAFQCAEMSGSVHHTVDDFNYMEIVDKSGKPVEPRQKGRVVITSLLKHAYPLIRYEIGDEARFIGEPCACGRKNRVIEYLGRSDDTLSVGMMNLNYRDISESLQSFGLSELQLAAKNDSRGEYIEVRAEVADTGASNAEKIKNALVERTPKLAERLADGGLVEIRVTLFKNGGLPRNPRTGKIKAFVDERA